MEISIPEIKYLRVLISCPRSANIPYPLRMQAYRDVLRYLSDMENICLILTNEEGLLEDSLLMNVSMLSQSDIVYFYKDWDQYQSCVTLHDIASRRGKTLIHEGEI